MLKSLLLDEVAPRERGGTARPPWPSAEGKCAFLRTKAFFGKCMDQAENDYGWEKRSF